MTLLITTDEETTKQGARVIAERSALVRAVRPTGILVVEPTRLQPVRGPSQPYPVHLRRARRAGA